MARTNQNLEFEKRNKKLIQAMNRDNVLKELSLNWFLTSHKYEYSYHFKWLGRPIIQYPPDILAVQEIIWKTKPDLIIETGIARGGSLVFSASILELIGNGNVLGIDIDIRPHNKKEIESHPLSKRISLIEGSSIDKKIVNQVYHIAKNKKKILLLLDSDHSYKHVMRELELYSPLVKKGNYIVVFDTIIEDMPSNWLRENGIDRPWNKKNNPKTAVRKFLKNNSRFKNDSSIEKKLLISVSPEGYLKCIKN